MRYICTLLIGIILSGCTNNSLATDNDNMKEGSIPRGEFCVYENQDAECGILDVLVDATPDTVDETEKALLKTLQSSDEFKDVRLVKTNPNLRRIVLYFEPEIDMIRARNFVNKQTNVRNATFRYRSKFGL